MINKNKIVILTGNELRHQYFRQRIAQSKNIKVLCSYCESDERNLYSIVRKESIVNSLRLQHLEQRQKYEEEFFLDFCQKTDDESNSTIIPKGDINKEEYVQEIIKLNPDMIISYGCSIIKSELMYLFKKRFINVHLGLSPYYRGSGTNYFPFVNGEPVFCGVTFMYIDEGVDTGDIIYQIRADIRENDNIHIIGNRLIKDMTDEVQFLIQNFNTLKITNVTFPDLPRNYYRNKDFTEDTLRKVYQNFADGMIYNYLLNQSFLIEKYPIKQIIK